MPKKKLTNFDFFKVWFENTTQNSLNKDQRDLAELILNAPSGSRIRSLVRIIDLFYSLYNEPTMYQITNGKETKSATART